jgi:hypothetical protein
METPTQTNWIEEAIQQLNTIGGSDSEMAHIEADSVLLNYLRQTGSAELADAYDALKEKTAFYYA